MDDAIDLDLDGEHIDLYDEILNGEHIDLNGELMNDRDLYPQEYQDKMNKKINGNKRVLTFDENVFDKPTMRVTRMKLDDDTQEELRKQAINKQKREYYLFLKNYEPEKYRALLDKKTKYRKTRETKKAGGKKQKRRKTRAFRR